MFRIGSERMLRRLVTGQVVDTRAAGAGAIAHRFPSEDGRERMTYRDRPATDASLN